MATLRMSGLATSDIARSDAVHRQQVMRKPASTRNQSSGSGRVAAGARVLRVLVVDAERDSPAALLRRVRHAGHAAHAAADGLAALRVAAAWHADVVLLDMDTPLMDGRQVAKRLRSDCSSQDCLIIAFAKGADDARRNPCLEAGIDLLLSKPVDPEVVGTLLMLERVRVNRRRALEAGNKLDSLT